MDPKSIHASHVNEYSIFSESVSSRCLSPCSVE